MSVYGKFPAAALSLPQGGEWHPFKRQSAGAHPFKRQSAAQHPFQHLGGAQHPFFAATAGLHPFMALAAAQHPFFAATGGLHPFEPPAGSLHPFAQQGASAQADEGQLPSPWLGIDPDWVYGGADSLQAQAMRRVRTELTGLVAVKGAAGGKVANDLEPLWHWGAEFRIKTLLGELAARVFVDDGCVKVVAKPGTAAQDGLRLAGDFGDDKWWDDQIDKVLRAAVEREDRLPEILTQADSFWEYFAMVTGLRLDLAPRTVELLEVATEWATLVVMGLKHHHALLRPMQRSQLVMPIIDTPAHATLPSGHATVSRLYADLLTELLYGGASQSLRVRQLDVLARRIAFNRVVAGVHFQVDSVAGHVLGRYLAHSFIAIAKGGELDLGCTVTLENEASLKERDSSEPSLKPDTSSTLVAAEQLGKLWAAVTKELEGLRV